MLRVLTVCTGNVCRSPLAALLLAERLKGSPVIVESAGIRALVDQPTTVETERIAIEHGLTSEIVATHRARLATEDVLGEADLILAMAREHRHAIVDLVPRRLRSTFTLRELARLGHEATDAELEEAAAGSADPQERLRRVLAFVSSLRGTLDPPPAAADDDVVDPYRRSWDTYLLSASQLVPAIDDVVRVLRVAAGVGSGFDSASPHSARFDSASPRSTTDGGGWASPRSTTDGGGWASPRSTTDGSDWASPRSTTESGDGTSEPRMGIWAPTERHSWN